MTCVAGNTHNVLFKFSHHCFTDSQQKAGDFRFPYIDPAIQDPKPRVFCPMRWMLSQRLVELIKSGIERKSLALTDGCQWVLNEDIAGMSRPYVVFMKFGAPRPHNPLIININSAFIRSEGKIKGNMYKFPLLLKRAASGANMCDDSWI